ncbi:MAG: HAD family phosphatase [Rubrobacter sp.]|nr:HAD family phosphatase [Rubrobacter sp.]
MPSSVARPARNGDETLKALLFDLDGTLAETDSLHFPAWAAVLEPHGVEVDAEFYRDRISGRLDDEIAAELLPHLPEAEARTVVHSKEVAFREQAGEVLPLPGLVEVLEKARGRGLRMALVTNAPRENAAFMLRTLGLEGFFDLEVLAEEVAFGKPDPLIYVTALERLGVGPERAVAFEDSPSGIRSAVGAGLFTVGIASTHDPEKLMSAGASVVAADFRDPQMRSGLGL